MRSVLPKEIANQIPKISPFAVAAICIASAVALAAFAAWHEEEHEVEVEQNSHEGQEASPIRSNIAGTANQEPNPISASDAMTRKEEIESKKDEIFSRWIAQQ